MESLRRTLGVVLVTIAAIVLGELLLQAPLYRWLQPVILTPAEGAVVSLPLVVQWDGPPRLFLWLLADGGGARPLGIQRSPFELSAAQLPAPGAYRLQARAPILGTLIQTERRFAVAAPAAPPNPAPPRDPRVGALTSVIESLKASHEQTRAENSVLYEENAALRQENAALLQEIKKAGQAADDANERAAAHRERQAQLTQENRTLNEQLTMMQWQLNAALTCSVWGYYSYPHPQTIPVTRRTITVSDPRGEVFRTEPACELFRQTDPTAASRCFCVGTPWGS